MGSPRSPPALIRLASLADDGQLRTIVSQT